MEIREIKSQDMITLELEGRVDTNTSAVLQAEVLKAFQKSKNVSLDLKEVPYVSSAGLRTFLIAHKTAESKGGKFELYHVSEEILSVLNMSGFSKFLHIK